MAAPDWTNGNGTNIWSDGANWSTAVKPQAGDTVTFTNTSVANCTVDEVTAEIASLTIGGTASGVYSGTITASNKIQMTGNAVIEDGCTGTLDMNADIDIDGDFTGDGAGVTVLCGSGTWTCDGNFDNKDIGTWTRETSHVVLTGTTKILTSGSTKDFYDLTFLNGSSITVSINTSARVDTAHTLTLDGTITLDANLAVIIDGDIVIGANAIIGGGRFLSSKGSASGHGITSVHADATLNCNIIFQDAVAGTKCVPLTTSGVFELTVIGATDTLLQLDALGNYNFGSIVLDNNGTGLITLDNATNGPASITCGNLTCDMAGTGNILVDGTDKGTDWTITGDVIQTEGSSGRLTWTPGTGTMLFSGNNDVDIDFNGQTTESITITNASGTVTFGDAITTAAFTGEPNASIAGAVLITVQGNFALNGTSGNEITFNGPDLDVTGTAVAHFTTATNSDASAGTKVTATDNCVDGTGNTNWDFSIEAFRYYYDQQEATA